MGTADDAEGEKREKRGGEIPGYPVAEMREAVARAIRGTTLRRVAREVGMAPNGLAKFVRGAVSREDTLRKVLAWYVQHAARSHDASPPVARAALAVMLERMPPKDRGWAERALLTAVAKIYRDMGVAVPEWLTTLRERGRRAG
jgi:hypothetical protein